MDTLMTPDELLRHWQGHRRLTRRTIDAFPSDALFSHRVGPLRPFGEMIKEALEVEPILRGIATGEWAWTYAYPDAHDQKRLLEAWDDSERLIHRYWPQITPERLREVEPDPFFGGPEQANLNRLLYQIDNEIHHRGQGYIYLRQLGIEPPPFHAR